MDELMKRWRRGAWVGCLALTAGAVAADADEEGIRSADALRLTAVRSGRYDDLPAAIAEQMRLSGSSIDWQATRIEVARSGDLAYETARYVISFRSPGGSPLTDRGTLLQVWQKQDGLWKVVAEAWTSAPGAVPASAPMPAATAVPGGDYGDPPERYQQTIDQYFQRMLKHPESVQYREVTPPERGSASVVKGMMSRSLRELGWRVSATVNAQNAAGRYVGFKTYVFLFRGEQIVSAKAPTPDGEMNF